MLLEIFSFVKNIFSPAAELIDNLHTSAEEKLTLRNELAQIEGATTLKIIEYEGKLLEARSKIIVSESQSDLWIVKAWRPMTMLTFVSIVVMYWFGYQPENMTQESIDNIFLLIQIGLGGYIAGRSVEKAVKTYKS